MSLWLIVVAIWLLPAVVVSVLLLRQVRTHDSERSESTEIAGAEAPAVEGAVPGLAELLTQKM